MNKLKVLFITSWYPTEDNPVKGVFVREHAKAVSLYNDVVVMHLEGDDRALRGLSEYKEEKEEGIRTIRVKCRYIPVPKLTYLNYVATAIFAFRRLLRQGFKPDIIHSHIYRSAPPAVTIGKLFKIPVVISEHSSDFPRKRLSRKEIEKARFAMQRAQIILPVSEALKRGIEWYGIKNRFQIIPNVVNTNLFHPEGKLRKDMDVKRILLVALLSSVKGVPYLLQALSMLKKRRDDFFLDIVGDGPCRKEYEDLAVQLGIGHKVCFHGVKLKQEVAEFMRSTDFFVLPSLWENLPCVLIEAAASGLPIVATQVGGIPEIVNQKVGILVPSKDSNALARGIEYMLGSHRSYSPNEISEYARKHYSYEAVGRKLSNIYQEVKS